MSKNPEETLGQLLEQAQTLQLATLDAGGEPSISYAPFVQDEAGNFYIFVPYAGNLAPSASGGAVNRG